MSSYATYHSSCDIHRTTMAVGRDHAPGLVDRTIDTRR
jgi:hypothetical protein